MHLSLWEVMDLEEGSTMKTLLRKWATLAAALTLMLALCVTLTACGGGTQDEGSGSNEAAEEQQDQSQGSEAGESADEKVARYQAGYDQISEEWDISSPDPLTYEYIVSVMGDEGVWVVYDEEDYTWVPLEGEPVPGEEIALEYTVEGVTGAVLVMWNEGKDFNLHPISSQGAEYLIFSNWKCESC